jgi:glycosyltransferase involved in cell wall biosynthesis
VRIAFIVQRYGLEILGGSEYHCRLIAERMARRHDVEVLSTCARDYVTWANEYPEGTSAVNGVTVRRFANTRTRDIHRFNEYSDWIFHHAHTRADEMSWLELQGPWCPALIDYLDANSRAYDALIFFTYLYAPTVLGLGIDPGRSILAPTAHDEPAIHLTIYAETFQKPAAIAFNTDVEKKFLKSTFTFGAVAEETIGCGVDLLGEQVHQRRPPKAFPPSPFVLYGGRIDQGKGCGELLEHFDAYRLDGGHASLAFMGERLMALPNAPWFHYAGLVSEADRLRALASATLVTVPSRFESLSLLALEAMAVGTPILCNAHADVLVEHCRQSQAGLFYANRDEFVECAKLMIEDERLRTRMGRNGQTYVRSRYHWDVIMNKYDTLIAALPGRQGTRVP